MHLCASERPRRLLGSGIILFQPWDVWIGHKRGDTKRQAYIARKDKNIDQGATTRQIRDGSPYLSKSPHLERKKKVILFDLTTAELRQAAAVVDPVTQDTNLGYIDGEVNRGDIAGGSTWEYI